MNLLLFYNHVATATVQYKIIGTLTQTIYSEADGWGGNRINFPLKDPYSTLCVMRNYVTYFLV